MTSPTGAGGGLPLGLVPPLTGVPGWYPGAPVTVETALRSGRRLVDPRWGVPDAVGTVVGAVLLAVLAAGLVGGLPPGSQLLVALVVPWLALGGWPVLATYRRGNGPVVDLGLSFGRAEATWGLGGGVVALVLGYLAGLATEAVAGEFDSAAGDAAGSLAGQRVALVVFAVLVALAAPVVEELAFRGLMYGSLVKAGLSAVPSIAVSTVLFAGFHFEPVRILVLLVIGTVLGVVRWRSGSTGAAMIAHAVNNIPGAIALALM